MVASGWRAGSTVLTRNGHDRFPAIATPLMIERCRLAQRVVEGAYFDSLDDLNFIKEPFIVVWTIRRSAVGLMAVDRAGFSHRPEPKMTSAESNQRHWQPASDGTSVQRPVCRGQGPEGQCKASINPAAAGQSAGS